MLRTITLDYPLKCLDSSAETRRVMGELLVAKQMGFLRANPDYIALDKHDLIGTHLLVVDQKSESEWSIVGAIRNTYSDRAQFHNLPLPVDSYWSNLPEHGRAAIQDIRTKGILVDCGGLFLSPDYSHKNSGLKLCELLFFLVTCHLIRRSLDHFIGATNQRFRADRWIEPIAHLPKNIEFIHPNMPEPHRLIIARDFNWSWLRNCYFEYRDLMANHIEVVPSCSPMPMSMQELFKTLEPLRAG